MLISHKFVDALLGRSDEVRLAVAQGVDPGLAAVLADSIQLAEKFDFGDIHSEVAPDASGGIYLPRPTEVEVEAWEAGLLPLPAPLCWYEFVIHGWRSGVLVFDMDGGWRTTRFDWVPGRELHVDSHAASIFRATGFHNVEIRAPRSLHSQAERLYLAIPALVLYLTLMIGSRSTELVREVAPPKLNRRRVARDRAPLADHTVVRILPVRYLRERLAEAGAGRLPPRLHWRRSHVRTLHRDLPTERRVLIPRFLVGRAADGEVTHEYRIVGGR